MKRGLKILSFKPSSKSSPKENDTDSGQESNQRQSYLKRREQVRRAQKTYRERQQEYVKSLETQVVQLKSNESNIMSETQRLHSEVRMLRQFITNKGFEPPKFTEDLVTTPKTPKSQVSPAMHFFVGDGPTKAPQLHALRASSNFSTSQAARKSKSKSPPEDLFLEHISDYESSLPSLQTGTTLSGGLPLSPQSAHAVKAPVTKVAELDLLAVGIEFVLTLEGPCLNHVPPNPASPKEPTGHALSATAPIVHLGNSTNSALGSATWSAPVATLQNLLQLSRDLPLIDDVEITPVQIWNSLLAHPKFGDLDITRFKVLTCKLLSQVQCHGFGAVVERVQYEHACFEAFVVGRVFDTGALAT